MSEAFFPFKETCSKTNHCTEVKTLLHNELSQIQGLKTVFLALKSTGQQAIPTWLCSLMILVSLINQLRLAYIEWPPSLHALTKASHKTSLDSRSKLKTTTTTTTILPIQSYTARGQREREKSRSFFAINLPHTIWPYIRIYLCLVQFSILYSQ